MEGNQVVKLIVTQPAPHDDDVDNGPFFRVLLYEKSEWEITVHILQYLDRQVIFKSGAKGMRGCSMFNFFGPEKNLQQ